eukprot:7308428-Karenia_brevis.AAC.1
MQDWVTLLNYLTAEVWANVMHAPFLALDILCQHFSNMGLICPSEPTCAIIAAAACSLTPQLHPAAVQAIYEAVKKRIKHLYRAEPP